MSPRTRAWIAWLVGALHGYGVMYACHDAGVSFWVTLLASASVWIVLERVALRLLGDANGGRK